LPLQWVRAVGAGPHRLLSTIHYPLSTIHALRLCLCALLIWSAGCGGSAKWQDRVGARDPMVKKAEAKERNGDYRGAIEDLYKALERKPRLAYAHRKLAELLDKHENDPVGTIYHCRRYLALVPKTEKRAMIEDWIRTQYVALRATGSEAPPDAATAIARLKKENMQLRDELTALRRELRRNEPIAVSPPPAAPTPTPSGPVRLGRLYKVEPGDTLSRIAAKFYGSATRWDLIFEANRDRLATPGALKVGQELIIPEQDVEVVRE